jgi:hypothetical protein
MYIPKSLVVLLVLVVVLVAVVGVVRAMAHRNSATGQRRFSLGVAATALLIGGAAVTAFGFVATIRDGGAELHGSGETSAHVLGWMLGGGIIATLLGLLLGLLALIRLAVVRGLPKDS